MRRRRVHAGIRRIALLGAAGVVCLALASCGKFGADVDPRYGAPSSPRLVSRGEPVPKGGGYYRVGKPYVIAGRTYVPEDNPNYSAVGLASWYGVDFHGRQTANGEIYDMHAISAAHPTLPIPSYARVTNLSNGRSIVVRVNDRGPYAENRIVDLSVKTAKLLGFHHVGLTRVRVDYVGPAPLKGSDDHMLVATLRHGSPAPAPSGVRLASAKPLAPGFGMSRFGRVPVPDERPYTLGETDVAALPKSDRAVDRRKNIAAAPKPPVAAEQEVAAVSSARAQTPFESRWTIAVPSSGTIAAPAATGDMPSPASAYRPERYQSAPGFISGRGLY